LLLYIKIKNKGVKKGKMEWQEKLIILLSICVIAGLIGGTVGAGIFGMFGFLIGFGIGFFVPVAIYIDLV